VAAQAGSDAGSKQGQSNPDNCVCRQPEDGPQGRHDPSVANGHAAFALDG